MSGERGAVRGAVGTVTLPEDVKMSGVPDESAQGSMQRTTWTLDYVQEGKPARAAIYQSCGPNIAMSKTDRGIEVLMSAAAIAGGGLLASPSRWTVLGSHRAYKMETVGKSGVESTQWMLPLGDMFATVRFERLKDASIERGILDAIENMAISCGSNDSARPLKEG